MISFYPLLPPWLILIAGILSLGVVYFVFKNGLDLPKWKRILLAGIRTAVIVIVIIMLLCPGMTILEQNRQRSNIVVLLDDSGSMATRDMPGNISRYRAALSSAQKLKGVDFSDCRKHFYTFSTSTEAIKDWDVPDMSGAQGGTDFEQAFDAVNRDVGLSKTAAVVLLSDGLDNSKFSGNKLGAPVFAVKFGTDLVNVPDLRIDEFTHPRTLYVNEEFELSVPVTLNGYEDKQSVRATFFIDDKQIKEKEFTMESGQSTNLNFKFSFNKPALHTIKIKLDQLIDEAGYLNNESEFMVEVRSGQNYTICYFPQLNNSFRPLVRQLRASGRKFSAVYRLRSNKFNQIGTRINPVLNGGIPDTAAAMKDIDIFILGSSDSDLNTRKASVLEQYVANGGTLIMLGGQGAFGALSSKSPLASVVPVKSRGSSFVPGDFRIAPGHKLQRSRFADRIAELCAGTSSTLKGINIVESVKKGAEVLLTAEAAEKCPLLVALPYGRGKAVALLTNSLHLWGQGRQRQHNFGVFWEQLINYAGHSENDILKVALNKTRLPENEVLKVSVKADFPEKVLSSPAFKIESSLYRNRSDRATAIKKLHKDALLYKTEFSKLKSGRYILETQAVVDSQMLAKRYQLVTVGNNISEGSNLKAVDENFLKFCSESRIYGNADQPRLIRDIIRTIRKNDIEREWYILFETPIFYFTLLILLTTGWYLRRRFNLF